MKTIKSKKSYIDFEDLLDEEELKYKKCKKKKNKKHKSSKKSSNKKRKSKKKITKQDIEITNDFFGLNQKQTKETKSNYKKITYHYSKSWLGRVADSVNIDAKFNLDISDDFVNNLFLIASGIISKLLIKK